MPAELIRRRVTVSGQVQGVWFRETCRREAEALGLGGYVRNLSDGSVEAVFEGKATPVQAMVSWCRVGPRRARVETIEVASEVPDGEPGFKVR